MKAMREAACSPKGKSKKKVEKIMEEADDGQVGTLPKGGPLAAGKPAKPSRALRLTKKK